MNLHIYLLDWHHKFSPAFHEIFINLFEGNTDLKLTPWDGFEIMPEWINFNEDDVFIFCQKRPPINIFKGRQDAKVIWIPMWNNVQNMGIKEWALIPKHFRILAYSPLITKFSEKAGLETLQVCYAPDINRFTPATWTQGNILYYWNRVGLINKSLLINICRALNVQKLLFRPNLDPGIPKERAYALTSNDIGIEVEIVPFFDTAVKSLDYLNQANIVIAPRPAEGVGLVFLEAMAAGKLVLSINQPTMSEYIESGHTGILLKSNRVWFEKTPMLSVKASSHQNWPKLKNIQHQMLGQNARLRIAELRQIWMRDQIKIRRFVYEWSNVQKIINTKDLFADVTEEQISELHRLAFDVMKVDRLAPTFIKKLRYVREKLHPLYKQDLRIIKTGTGAKLQVNLGDHMGCDLFYGLFGEQQDFDLFNSAIKKGSTVIDVGSNIGIYAITAAQLSGKSGRIFAFEPGTHARELLTRNLNLNKLSGRVKSFGVCVGDFDGKILFNESRDSSLSSINVNKRSGPYSTFSMPIIKLDTAMECEGVSKIDLLKIDVEGSEGDVLKGAMQILSRSDAIIMLEISLKNLSEKSLFDMRLQLIELQKLGYRAMRIMPQSFELRIFETMDNIFDEKNLKIGGNYFLARSDTDQFDRLIKIFFSIKSILVIPNRVFRSRPRSRLNFRSRNNAIIWAEQLKSSISIDLINKIGEEKDKLSVLNSASSA
jgi:FkbM family methyltransferase